jgi:hypothetical protein
MIDLDPLRPIIVNAANANDTVDLKTTNIVLLTIPNYNNRSLYDTINIYFDDSLYYTYIVNSLVGNMIVDIPKDKIRKQDYNINYTITDSSDNIITRKVKFTTSLILMSGLSLESLYFLMHAKTSSI